MNAHICKYCGKEFKSGRALGGHIVSCGPNRERHSEILKAGLKNSDKVGKREHIVKCLKCGKEFIVICTNKAFLKGNYSKYCSRSCGNSRERSLEVRTKIGNGIKAFAKNNPNLIKQQADKKCKGVIKICKNCNKEFTYYSERAAETFHITQTFSSYRYCSPECKHAYLSKHTGGLRESSTSNRFIKSGWYKGYYCDSSWELAFVMYHLDNNLKIERCREARKYIFDGQEYNYYPDFITDEGVIEIKGYSSDRWKAKLEANPDVKVLYKKEIQKYLDYAREKYGENFTDLYEK